MRPAIEHKSRLARLCDVALAAALLLIAQDARALDASPWERVLSRCAGQRGVNYAKLKADRDARGDLASFVHSIASMSSSEPLAAWLNAYNALVVSSVVRRYPLRSVMDIPGFFNKERHRIAGERRTLDEIEHDIIRKRFRDARVHMALNCAARSCPPLHPHAFRQRTLQATLDRLARNVVTSPRHVRIGPAQLAVSPVFFWFRKDFETEASSLLAWLKRYARSRLAGLPQSTPIVKGDYDWRLNDARGP
ncbi:MAG: DUF547 domain-containing protein [Proteobacteria bacterium]|nr:DUF547 domain-containing protein [Pseudomonadota bacterium]